MAFGHSMILYSHLQSSNGKVSLVAHKIWAQLWLKGIDLYETFYLFVLACSHKYHPLPSIAIYVGKALDMFSLRVYWPSTTMWSKGVNIIYRFVLFSTMPVGMRPPFHTSIRFNQASFCCHILFVWVAKMSLNLNEQI